MKVGESGYGISNFATTDDEMTKHFRGIEKTGTTQPRKGVLHYLGGRATEAYKRAVGSTGREGVGLCAAAGSQGKGVLVIFRSRWRGNFRRWSTLVRAAIIGGCSCFPQADYYGTYSLLDRS